MFAVNPNTCAESYVYPLAKNFEDFLHSEDNPIVPEQRKVLDRIQAEFNLTPMENPFEYVQAVQAQFNDSKIKFSNEYYDILGIERPDGLERESEPVEFDTVAFAFVKRGNK